MGQQDTDLRTFRRLEMYAGVFMVQGEKAYLSELTNVSAGGVSVKRPGTWQHDPEGIYQLFFVLDQDRILADDINASIGFFKAERSSWIQDLN